LECYPSRERRGLTWSPANPAIWPSLRRDGTYQARMEIAMDAHSTGGDPNDPFSVDTEERPEGMVVHVSGEVDLANTDRLKGAIQPALSNYRNVILDVSHLKYIDSAGLYILLRANTELRRNKCQLVVVGASPVIAKVMLIFGFDGLMPLVSSLEEATNLLRNDS
jgi:anti-anti-sigma factor